MAGSVTSLTGRASEMDRASSALAYDRMGSITARGDRVGTSVGSKPGRFRVQMMSSRLPRRPPQCLHPRSPRPSERLSPAPRSFLFRMLNELPVDGEDETVFHGASVRMISVRCAHLSRIHVKKRSAVLADDLVARSGEESPVRPDGTRSTTRTRVEGAAATSRTDRVPGPPE